MQGGATGKMNGREEDEERKRRGKAHGLPFPAQPFFFSEEGPMPMPVWW
jgi:hypothetical protein